MNAQQTAAYRQALTQARTLIARNALDDGFSQLERAHVLGQAEVLPHVQTHVLMLQVEWRRRRPLALLGQAVRIVLGALGSAVGVVPTGNTGGTDISMFKRLPIDPELQRIIDGSSD